MEFLKKSWKWVAGTIGFKEKSTTKKKINTTNQQIKNIRKKKPVVKKKTGDKAAKSVRNRLK